MDSNMVGTSAQANPHFNVDLMSGTYSHVPFTPNLEHSIFLTKIVDRKAFTTSDWVIDIEATDHMVHSISWFATVISTLNTFVNLPNGETALVTHIGTVKLSEKLTLTNVLCVPSFSFNLLSVNQLAKTNFCCLIFFGNMYFIQDLAYWSTVGLGKEFKGLYLLEKSISISSSCFSTAGSINSAVNNVVKSEIWHSRLGHLSNAKLALMRDNNVPLFHDNK